LAEHEQLKNKLFKGLTEHDILSWEEEKMRYQRKMGRKVTDVEFLRYLLMRATRPVISSKDGVATGFLTGQGPIYDKGETLLNKYRSRTPENEGTPTLTEALQKSKIPTSRTSL